VAPPRCDPDTGTISSSDLEEIKAVAAAQGLQFVAQLAVKCWLQFKAAAPPQAAAAVVALAPATPGVPMSAAGKHTLGLQTSQGRGRCRVGVHMCRSAHRSGHQKPMDQGCLHTAANDSNMLDTQTSIVHGSVVPARHLPALHPTPHLPSNKPSSSTSAVVGVCCCSSGRKRFKHLCHAGLERPPECHSNPPSAAAAAAASRAKHRHCRSSSSGTRGGASSRKQRYYQHWQQ
jgi:hypothetical protein